MKCVRIKRVEQQQVEQDVDVGDQLVARVFRHLALAQRQREQEAAVHQKSVKIGQHDADQDQQHAAKIAQRQGAKHQRRGNRRPAARSAPAGS
jgi:hypothetical protein